MVDRTQIVPMLLNLVAAFIGAFGQYFYKIGSGRLGTIPLYKNWPIFVGMFLFTAVMFLFVVAFKMGGRMSVVYPVYATTFIWGTLIAVVINREPYSIMQLVGVGVVVLGVMIVAITAPQG